MPSSSSQSASIFNEAAQFYQHQRHQYQTNDDYAAAMAYYRARILAADSTAKSYVDSLTKPSQCMPATTASSAAMTTTPFMPMIHSLETEAEDEAGVKPPYCEDLALDLAEYRWRISTRPHRLDLAKRRADQEALPFLERSALIRTSKDMGSYARLLAAARMEEKGTQIWTPPQGVDDDNDNCGTYNNIISNSNNNSETIENNAINDKKPDETVVEQGRGRRRKRRVSSNSNNSTDMGMVSQTLLVGSGNSDGEEDDDDDDYCCDDEGAERQLSEAEMMGGYDYAPYLRREDRDAMVSRIAFYPEITHQQAYVPDLPFPTTAAIAPMTKQSAEAGLCRAVGEILMENGFAEADERALAILTDMASELIAKLANNVRIAVDNNPKRFSNEFTLRKAWKSVCDTGIAPRKVIDEEAQRRQQKRSGNDEDNN